MNDLVPKECMTARTQSGCFFATAEGVNYLEPGPPIRVQRIAFSQDNPKWEELSPWDVSLDTLALRRECHELRRELERTPTPIIDGEPVGRPRDERFLRDCDWLFSRVIGRDLVRTACRLPATAQPYVCIWLAQCERGFYQLLKSCPMLATGLLRSWIEEHRGSRSAGDLVSWMRGMTELPRSRLTETLGLPRRASRGIRKIAHPASDPTLLPALAEQLASEDLLTRFNHARQIGPSEVRFFSNERLRRHVTKEFLRELATADRGAREAFHAQAVEDLLPVVERLPPDLGLSPWSSIHRLYDFWAALFEQRSPAQVEFLLDTVFPVPPVDGLHDIMRPIRTGLGLLAQAIRMQNCIFSPPYFQDLRAGQCHLYFIRSAPGVEPCTVELRPVTNWKGDSQTMTIATVLGRSNREVSQSTLTVVRLWADQVGIDPGRYGRHEQEGQLVFSYADPFPMR